MGKNSHVTKNFHPKNRIFVQSEKKYSAESGKFLMFS